MSNEATKPSTADLTLDELIKRWTNVLGLFKNDEVIKATIAALERLQESEKLLSEVVEADEAAIAELRASGFPPDKDDKYFKLTRKVKSFVEGSKP